MHRFPSIFLIGAWPSFLYSRRFSHTIYFTAETAVSLFTTNKEVIKYGKTYLQITALMEPVYPIFFISNAVLQGMKKAMYVITNQSCQCLFTFTMTPKSFVL